MKKLFLLFAACCMIFVACNNKKAEKEATKEDNKAQTEQTEGCDKKCDKECCKKMMEDWANFDNLTAEEKTQILEKKGGFITDMLSKVELDKIECPNAKQGIEEFKTKWEGFAAADEAGKKALIDEFDNAEWKHAVLPEKCCKEGEEGCCKDGKEGCCDKKEGCCDKK